MGVVAVMAAGLLASVVTAINAAHGQSLRASHDVCSRIEFVTGEDHQVVEKVLKKVLKELCETGQRHVVQEQRLSRGGEQFAVLNLHRDAFRATVYWQGGDAKNVVDDSDWRVDEEVALAPGKEEDDAKAKIFYHWYRHGLPMWPLLNQALKKTNFFRRLFKKLNFRGRLFRTPKWPNYALATPLYLVPYERNNYREEIISMNKMFHKKENQKNFKDSVHFKKYVNEFCRKTCDNIQTDPDRLSNWLVPLIDHSFTHMMASFKEQQRARAPKNSKLSRCPDQLYVFLLHKPCQRDLQLLNKKFDDLLSSESCLNITRLVVGYSAEVPPFVC
ncbi:uncharacterized protein LOC135103067 [Scylla paramamosain]|uniref:uncharacterized protein LOC135103067 n=1 Tax=Scylla paramamosain TaxID=85552 RepID=UPI003083DEB6